MRRHDPLARIEMALVAEEVSSGVRHDLRNQITIIRGALFFLRRKVTGTDAWKSDTRVGEFFKAIEEQLDRATANVEPERLSEQLFVRKVGATEVRECVALALENTSLDPRVRVTSEVEDCFVDVDPREIAFALRCLLESAEEAMPEGGHIELRAGPWPSTGCASIEVRVSVAGPGRASPANALQPFAGAKDGPVGLGLSMASRICRRYGGRIIVHPGEHGSSVELTLPLCTSRERRHEQTAPRG